MKTDQQTKKELSVLNGDISLFSYFDHMDLAQSKSKLRAILDQPLISCKEISTRQSLLKYFQKHKELSAGWQDFVNTAPLGEANSHCISQYCTHNFPDTIGGRFSATRKKYESPDAYSRLYSRITAVIRTFSLFLQLFKKVTGEKSIDSFLDLCKPQWNNPLVQETVDKISKEEELPTLLVFQIDRYVRSYARIFFKLLWNTIFLWDAYFSTIKTIKIHGLNFPEIQESNTAYINIKELKHPMVSGCVSNDFDLNNKNRVSFTTGSNMAGKTTFGKSLGTAVYLAHCGLPIPAESMRVSFLHSFHSSFYIHDDLHRGFSFFKSELARLKEILKDWEPEKPFLLIIDEPFSGTNYQDSRDCTRSLIESILETKNFLLLILTHHIELANEYVNESLIRLQCLNAEQDGSNLNLSYKLKEGISDQKTGWFLYKKEGLRNLLLIKKK